MAALLWGSSATAAKFFFIRAVSPLLLVESRVLIAAVGLTLYLLLTHPEVLKVKAGDIIDFALLGIIGVAGSNYAYYAAIKETSVAIAILLQYTAPVLVAVYSILMRVEKISMIKTAAVVLSLAGCTIMLGLFSSDVKLTSAGVFFGLLSALCFAFFNIYAKVANKRYPVWTLLTYTILSASVFWIVLDLFIHTGINLSDVNPIVLILFSFASALLPYIFYFRGLRRLRPSTAIVVATIEPVVAIGTAAFFLGEVLQIIQVIGGLLIVAAVILLEAFGE